MGIDLEVRLYGDDERVRHLRVVLETSDLTTAERCISANIQTWCTSLEAAASIESDFPYVIPGMPGTTTFFVTHGPCTDGSEPAAIIQPTTHRVHPVNYTVIAQAMAFWAPSMRHHLFYFRRMIDTRMPLDVRWLNGYRLLEWHFVGDGANLSRDPAWRALLDRFRSEIGPLCRIRQPAHGLFEEARALSAHAGLDERTYEVRVLDPANVMEKTFPVLRKLVLTVLNEHPDRRGPITLTETGT